MADDEQRGQEPGGRHRDLAAMVAPLQRALLAAERPVLLAHDISMWGYIVLSALARESTRTQAALAQAIRADKTRIIGVLDELQARGLIQRVPDPADRRARLLSLTDEGRRVRASVQAGIRQREERLLAHLPLSDRDAFVRALSALSEICSNERGADPDDSD